MMCVITYLPSSNIIVILGPITYEPLNLTLPPTIINHTQCGPIM